jgi:hypothetical protein
LRKFLLSLAVPVVMAGALATLPAGGAGAATAAAIDAQFICLNSNSLYCWNDQNGSLSAGNPIQLWDEAQGTAANQMVFNPIVIGPVSQHRLFDDQNLDNRYSTATVLQIEYLANGGTTQTGDCVGSNGKGEMTIEPCSSGNYWVVPDYNGGGPHTLISVYVTNLFDSTEEPFYATASPAQDGTKVYGNNSVQYWQF